ncbi:hypothetical protein M407DRAFT_34496 [Tulasnella calospora MUT 4182]|uniref:Uncharacterized protein n=1 Tax=Tulasnella calospora MUT 4182 TaxID=1051891 RepID=A0A0C3L2G0_9AGAM|nr:hypothetical protein M407DRAFT_34496 [Tulasnella calospora MUT 4182]
MTSIWKISSKPSDATQLLTVTATNGAVSLFTRTSPNPSCFWFRTRLDSFEEPGLSEYLISLRAYRRTIVYFLIPNLQNLFLVALPKFQIYHTCN